MADSSSNAPAGWYPDTSAPTGQRWWDGSRWTEHVEEYRPQPRHRPRPQLQPPTDFVPAPHRQPPQFETFEPLQNQSWAHTGTIWIWLIVLLPIPQLLSILLFDWKGYLDESIASHSASDSLSFALLVLQVVAWSAAVLTLLFAAFDYHALKRDGVREPFHWAFTFLSSTLYVIGRSVVVRRRTGRGLAPLWGFVGVAVISIIFSVVLVLQFLVYLGMPMPDLL